MHSYRPAIAVALATFVASLLGMALRLVVPVQALNDSKAAVGGMAGLITLLLALVLGLLVYTAFTIYSTQQSEAQGLGPVVIELDDLLEQYGPEALRGRRGSASRSIRSSIILSPGTGLRAGSRGRQSCATSLHGTLRRACSRVPVQLSPSRTPCCGRAASRPATRS